MFLQLYEYIPMDNILQFSSFHNLLQILYLISLSAILMIFCLNLTGEIRLSISLLHSMSFNATSNGCQLYTDNLTSDFDKSSKLMEGIPSTSSSGNIELSSLLEVEGNKPANEDTSNAVPIVDRLRLFLLGRNVEPLLPSIKGTDTSEDFYDDELSNTEACENQNDNACSNMAFDELVKVMESKEGGEMPGNLPGGVLLDKSYVAAPGEMNSLLFSPSSEFPQSLAEAQGSTGFEVEAWRLENGGASLKRGMTYIKAASKLIKSLKAIEEHTYLKADGKSFAVLASVSTPDAPFASCFKTEILYCITPGPELPSEDPSCHLVISWRMNFLQSTMMKSMIENGARQGLTEGFTVFAEKLSQYVKPVDMEGISSSKEQILASLQAEQESDWKLLFQVLGNFTFIFFAFLGLYILIHIFIANTRIIEGLEFVGLDLPDSLGEIVVCVVLILQGQHVWNKIGRFFHARKQAGKIFMCRLSSIC